MEKELKIKMYSFTLDCINPYALAKFYAELLNWEIPFYTTTCSTKAVAVLKRTAITASKRKMKIVRGGKSQIRFAQGASSSERRT